MSGPRRYEVYDHGEGNYGSDPHPYDDCATCQRVNPEGANLFYRAEDLTPLLAERAGQQALPLAQTYVITSGYEYERVDLVAVCSSRERYERVAAAYGLASLYAPLVLDALFTDEVARGLTHYAVFIFEDGVVGNNDNGIVEPHPCGPAEDFESTIYRGGKTGVRYLVFHLWATDIAQAVAMAQVKLRALLDAGGKLKSYR